MNIETTNAIYNAVWQCLMHAQGEFENLRKIIERDSKWNPLASMHIHAARSALVCAAQVASSAKCHKAWEYVADCAAEFNQYLIDEVL
jgi:uncharacterized protein (UPF0276 family)